jgi:hypothetical protein
MMMWQVQPVFPAAHAATGELQGTPLQHWALFVHACPYVAQVPPLVPPPVRPPLLTPPVTPPLVPPLVPPPLQLLLEQVSPEPHVPQLIVPPQPSEIVPQLSPLGHAVRGVQQAPR